MNRLHRDTLGRLSWTLPGVSWTVFEASWISSATSLLVVLWSLLLLPPPARLLPIVHPGAQVSDAHAPGHPRDVKQNVIHQTRPPSSIAPWSSSGAHMPIVGAFGSGQGSVWAL